MSFGAIFKIFKKGSKAVGKGKGKKPTGGFAWPSGIRIGIYGHSNSGKTVYYTVLNEECKISKKLQISVTDNATAGEFLSNYRSLWGLGTAASAGTVVDLKGERKFPDSTAIDKILLFNAIADRTKKVAVVAYDYSGRAVSISDRDATADKVADFMAGCDGILFFFDPKVMGAELECQAHVASFVNMLERLAPLHARLPIPISLVVTKSDILPGFSGDAQVRLIKPEDEYIVSEDFELFLEKVLASPQIAGNAAWSGTVRSVLVRLKDFLRVVVSRTLDFQIFFVSSTGQQPEKIGSDVGRSLYAPPPRMQPVGVQEPFYWLLNSIIRNRRISKFRTLARYVSLISLIWIILYSIPFLYHFKMLLPQTIHVEKQILEPYKENIFRTSEGQRKDIMRAYDSYFRSLTVRWFFRDFQNPAKSIWEVYRQYNSNQATKELEQLIGKLCAIVADPNLWPTAVLTDSTVKLSEEQANLEKALEGFREGDETSVLYRRSDRVLSYWNQFKKAVAAPSDTTIWRAIQDQVGNDKIQNGKDLSPEEIRLGDLLSGRGTKKVQKAIAKQATGNFDQMTAAINDNSSPDYRLETAVNDLKKIADNLDRSSDAQTMERIDRYLSDAKIWNTPRPFKFEVQNIPADAHMHIAVAEKGKDPDWEAWYKKSGDIVNGYKYQIDWKIGDQIYLAIDTLRQPESHGRTSSDRIILDDKFSLFRMEGRQNFPNVGKTVTIQFKPNKLVDLLPVMK